MQSQLPQNIDEAGFGRIVLEEQRTSLVCFMADWSEPSRAMTAVVEEIEQEWRGKAEVLIIDPDSEPFLMTRYGVTAIPAFILFVGGHAAERAVGIRDFEDIDRLIAKNTGEER